jgi:CRP/FNR family cyclic AMP-dependent transcriptional regulator
MARRRADVLAQVPLFSGLPKRHLKGLANLAGERQLGEGSLLAEEGKPGDNFFVLVEGMARVVRGKKTVAQLRPGDWFGEISLIDGGPRTASVVAETPVEVMILSRKPFTSMLQREPSIVLKMLEELARRLRSIERPLTG